MILGTIDPRAGSRRALSFLLVLALSSLAGMVLAADNSIPVDANGLPLWETRQWTDFPVRLELADHQELEQLLATVPLASFNREQVTIQFDTPKDYHLVFTPRVTEAEAAALSRAGYSFTRVEDLERAGREAVEKVWAEQAAKGGDALKYGEKGFYPTHAQIGTDFAQLESDHPSICRTFTWGSSVQGRDLWGIVISDDVQNTEAEPEVRLSSTMHGDEPPGMVMLYNLAHYLVENYGQPGYDDVTYLVDNYEIHIMPLHNPDGYIADTRANANSVDLNRNFPEPEGSSNPTEIENVNYMNYANSHHFVLGENGHSGALVVNYPWDHTHTLAPDNDAFIKLSLEYSTYNSPMYNGSFSQGITNGAAWYVITGGLQDWAYHVTGSLDVTIEYYDTKWPSASVLDGLWDDNRESFMHFIKAARYGINGVVTGSDTGLPLDATVTVSGISKSVVTDPEHGDYYKLLDTGTYDVTFSADGYITKTVYDVATTWGTPTVLDVVLDPVAHGDVSGVVTDLAGNGLDAQVSVYTRPTGDFVTAVASSAPSGSYSINLIYGDYELRVVKSGYVTQTRNVTIGSEPLEEDFQLAQAQEVVLFFDDFEDGTGAWTGGWGLADPAEGYNSANCLNDSPGSNYPNNADNPMAMASGVDLTGAMSGELSFRAKWEIENTWDACFLEVSTNGGGSWTPVATSFTQPASGQGGQTPSGAPCYDDSRANWVLDQVDLAPYLGETDLRFRFRLASDTSVQKSGFFLDDFQILVVKEQTATPVPGAEILTAAVKAWPNPFNPQTTVKFTNPRAGKVNLAIYDVQGRLVRYLVNENLAAGDHSRIWDGRTNAGNPSPSGVYFARMISGQDAATAKLMLVK